MRPNGFSYNYWQPMICIKCKTAPARPKQKWCAGCFAAYNRAWRRDAMERQAKRRNRAVENARALIVAAFECLGGSEMTGYTAAAIVRDIDLSV